MTELEVNKTIHEGMGKCWHELTPHVRLDAKYGEQIGFICSCGDFFLTEIFPQTEHLSENNPSYTTSWADYGQALEWAQKQKWWDDFFLLNQEAWNAWNKAERTIPITQQPKVRFISMMFNILSGSTALAEFITAHPEYFKEGEKE